MYFALMGIAYFLKKAQLIFIKTNMVLKEEILLVIIVEDQCYRRIKCIGDVRNFAIMIYVTNASILLRNEIAEW